MKNHIGLLLFLAISGMLLILGMPSDAPTEFRDSGDRTPAGHVFSISQELDLLGDAIIGQNEIGRILENSTGSRSRTSARGQNCEYYTTATNAARSPESRSFRLSGNTIHPISLPNPPLYIANMALLI